MANVPAMKGYRASLAAFSERFGWEPTLCSHRSWCKAHGIRPAHFERGCRRVERKVRWSQEPEMEAWMLEHDKGQSTAAVSDAFRERFGFGLTQTQVSSFRQSHGTTTKRSGGGRPQHPVGTVTEFGNGYVMCKVAESPKVPGSKDNWRPLPEVLWEREHGTRLPDGHVVVHANRNVHDNDPSNLVAVPKRVICIVNGAEWHDRDTLEAVVASALLGVGISDAVRSMPARCAVCGREFELPAKNLRARTCPECLAAGKRARPRNLGKGGTVSCAVCGREFQAMRRLDRRCPECMEAAPHMTVEQHLRRNERKAKGK